MPSSTTDLKTAGRVAEDLDEASRTIAQAVQDAVRLDETLTEVNSYARSAQRLIGHYRQEQDSGLTLDENQCCRLEEFLRDIEFLTDKMAE